jgi:hypothetical protein
LNFLLSFIFGNLSVFFIGFEFVLLSKKALTTRCNNEYQQILLGAMVALIGSRVGCMLENPSQIINQTWMIFYQSKTVTGGFLGGLFGVELIQKILFVEKNCMK